MSLRGDDWARKLWGVFFLDFDVGLMGSWRYFVGFGFVLMGWFVGLWV